MNRASKGQEILRFKSTWTFRFVSFLALLGVNRLHIFRQLMIAFDFLQSYLQRSLRLSYPWGPGLWLYLRVASLFIGLWAQDVVVVVVLSSLFGYTFREGFRHTGPILLDTNIFYLFVDSFNMVIDLPLIFQTFYQGFRNQFVDWTVFTVALLVRRYLTLTVAKLYIAGVKKLCSRLLNRMAMLMVTVLMTMMMMWMQGRVTCIDNVTAALGWVWR